MKRAGTGARRGSAVLVILVAAGLLLVIRSARDESDHGASRVLTAAPVAPAERDAVGVMRPLVVTDARPVQPMSGAHAAPAQASTDDALLCDSGLFAGVPRAWLAPLVLHGRVVDQDGAPLAGARITYLPEGSGSDLARNAGPARLRAEELEERLPSVTTAADGSFTLATARGIGLLGRERMSEITAGPALVVDDPRCAAYVHDCALGAAGDVDVGTLTVTAGAVITGRVVDASGAPLAGQHVRLETGDPETPTPGIVINVELPAALRVATT
ncbi:MAG TPA: hypothetical protein VK824_07000, partial [Planctomycetota bacterium]|nr:hypothetical protein [Planctomycetota bacterium]